MRHGTITHVGRVQRTNVSKAVRFKISGPEVYVISDCNRLAGFNGLVASAIHSRAIWSRRSRSSGSYLASEVRRIPNLDSCLSRAPGRVGDRSVFEIVVVIEGRAGARRLRRRRMLQELRRVAL